MYMCIFTHTYICKSYRLNVIMFFLTREHFEMCDITNSYNSNCVVYDYGIFYH